MTLPEHRRVLAGRTWPQCWQPASMDPIRHYTRPSTAGRVTSVLLATLLGVAGAILLVHWWST